MITLDLPLPPSVNETRRVNWAGHKKLKAWRETAGKTVWLNKQHKQAPITGPFEISITVAEDCRLDLDNLCKAAIDFCREHQFIQNDSPRYMKAISLRFDAEIPKGTCKIIISPVD